MAMIKKAGIKTKQFAIKKLKFQEFVLKINTIAEINKKATKSKNKKINRIFLQPLF